MDYIVCFDDGSKALAHYGVQGMKWGVWNAETAARRAGRRASRYRDKAFRAKSKAQAIDRMAFGRSSSVQRAKYKAKAEKYTKKANRSQWDPRQDTYRKAVNQRKALKYQRKAEGLSGRVSKVDALNAKAAKYDYKAEKMERAKAKHLKKLERTAESKVKTFKEHEKMAGDVGKLSGYKYHSGLLDDTRSDMSKNIRAMARKDPELQRDINKLNRMSPYDERGHTNKEYNATAVRIGKKVCGRHLNRRAFQEVAISEKAVVTGRR